MNAFEDILLFFSGTLAMSEIATFKRVDGRDYKIFRNSFLIERWISSKGKWTITTNLHIFRAIGVKIPGHMFAGNANIEKVIKHEMKRVWPFGRSEKTIIFIASDQVEKLGKRGIEGRFLLISLKKRPISQKPTNF